MNRNAPASLRPRQRIGTAKQLAVRLADRARRIRRSVSLALDTEAARGPLGALHAAFRQTLVHDLPTEEFADLVAQTVTYSLFSAAVSRGQRGGEIAPGDWIETLPVANPFLKQMWPALVAAGSPRGQADFDALGIRAVFELLASPETRLDEALNDLDERGRGEDPILRFYEDFLREYDNARRVLRGVFHTPQPAVSYLVRSVHELLQSEFDLEDGLASTATWCEMSERRAGLKIPEGVPPDSPFVQILDPATGTGTFLVEAIELVHRTLLAKWQRERKNAAQRQAAWNDYVPRHLLPRLHGYELMLAPYVIAHIRIGLKLLETGYRLADGDRARVFLTNCLESPRDASDALAHEARAVAEIKRRRRFTVILGNPPYSKISANLTPDMRTIVERYRFAGGERIRERGALQFEINLQDDYVKFFRCCEQCIEAAGVGILGLITNNGYLSAPTLRGMRESLAETFSSIWVNDLHGHVAKGESGPDGVAEENVFDILQGVAIFLGSRTASNRGGRAVFHAERFGSRAGKHAFLASHRRASTAFSRITPSPPFYLFVPHDDDLAREWNRGVGLAELFPRNSAGIVTARDALVIAEDEQVLAARLARFSVATGDDAAIYREFGFAASKRFDLQKAQGELAALASFREPIRRLLHRPFDERFVFFHPSVVWSPARPMADQLQRGDNLALIATRQVTRPQYEHAFVSRQMIEIKACSHDRNTQIFPLFVQESRGENVSCETIANLNRDVMRRVAENLSCKLAIESHEPGDDDELTPRRMFDYAYAILHAPGYRARYFEFLRSDFPRLPLTGNAKLFAALARLGGELVALHLLESPRLDGVERCYAGPVNPLVERVSHARDTVWLDGAQTRGFRGVPGNVWTFRIGGYQVCAKWLKDRKGRILSQADVERYQQILVALAETIRLMEEIERIIKRHGGWPAAFVAEH